MYHPIQPSQKDVEEMREMVRKEQGKELSDQEAYQASYDFLNFFNMLIYLDRKNKIPFKGTEDRTFFVDILSTDEDSLDVHHGKKFDFSEPTTKRAYFNKIKKSQMLTFANQGRVSCELRLKGIVCDNENLVLDHLIPLGTNKLNKYLRKMKGTKGKKTEPQSLGSNDPSNFLVACTNCNSHKKHRFVRKNKGRWEIYTFQPNQKP